MEKIATVFVSDTMGLTKLLPDYLVESTFKKIDDQATQAEISHFYSSSNWRDVGVEFCYKKKNCPGDAGNVKGGEKEIEDGHQRHS